jgi:hypothetical protein
MINAVAHATEVDQASASASNSRPAAQAPATQAKPTASLAPDTVTLTSAVLQEASESPAQTAREAGGGDQQAQRLLAKQASARKTE